MSQRKTERLKMASLSKLRIPLCKHATNVQVLRGVITTKKLVLTMRKKRLKVVDKRKKEKRRLGEYNT